MLDANSSIRKGDFFFRRSHDGILLVIQVIKPEIYFIFSGTLSQLGIYFTYEKLHQSITVSLNNCPEISLMTNVVKRQGFARFAPL